MSIKINIEKVTTPDNKIKYRVTSVTGMLRKHQLPGGFMVSAKLMCWWHDDQKSIEFSRTVSPGHRTLVRRIKVGYLLDRVDMRKAIDMVRECGMALHRYNYDRGIKVISNHEVEI